MFSFNQLFGSSEDQVTVVDAHHSLQNDPQNTLLLDVRTEQEYQTPGNSVHSSKLLPLQSLTERTREISTFKDKEVLVVCATGNRSQMAVGMLKQLGFSNVKNVSGGMSAWLRAGLSLNPGI